MSASRNPDNVRSRRKSTPIKQTSILTPFFGVVENTPEYCGEEMKYAIVPFGELRTIRHAVIYAASDELAQKITAFLNAEHEKEHPTCAGCRAFGPPVWEIADDDRGGWYHFTGGIHPFKEKYVWCVAMNKSDPDPTILKEAASKGFVLPQKADVKRAPVTMDEDTVIFHVKCLAGRILTLVDAMISTPEQNKAFKTYVKKEVREQFHRLFQYYHSSGVGCESSKPEEYQVAEEQLR